MPGLSRNVPALELTALRDTWNQKQAQILGAWLDGQMAGYVIVYFAADKRDCPDSRQMKSSGGKEGCRCSADDEMERVLAMPGSVQD